MDRAKFVEARQWVRDQLDNVAGFWLKNGMDADEFVALVHTIFNK